MKGTELFTILVSFLAVIVTLIGIIQNVQSTSIANLLANDANKAANQALEISKLGLRKDMLPWIEGDYLLNTGRQDGHLSLLQNLSVGRAIITNMEWSQEIQIKIAEDNNDIVYPFTLGYNEILLLTVSIEESDGTNHNDLNDFIEPSELINDSYIFLKMEDELGRKYNQFLKRDPIKKKFIGELNEETKDY